MKTILLSFALFIALFATSIAYGEDGCIHPPLGNIVCPPPGGEIYQTGIGEIICGPGKCLITGMGEVFCSSQPGGEVTIGSFGKIVCVGGCVKANPSYCQIPR